jgi:hypothetical protein
MIATLILLLTGFVVGLIYSRGKADPVASAIDDACHLVNQIGRGLQRAWVSLAAVFGPQKDSGHHS